MTKPKFKGNFFIRHMPVELHKTLRIRAEQEDTTITELVVRLLKESVEKGNAKSTEKEIAQ